MEDKMVLNISEGSYVSDTMVVRMTKQVSSYDELKFIVSNSIALHPSVAFHNNGKLQIMKIQDLETSQIQAFNSNPLTNKIPHLLPLVWNNICRQLSMDGAGVIDTEKNCIVDDVENVWVTVEFVKLEYSIKMGVLVRWTAPYDKQKNPELANKLFTSWQYYSDAVTYNRDGEVPPHIDTRNSLYNPMYLDLPETTDITLPILRYDAGTDELYYAPITFTGIKALIDGLVSRKND